MSSMVVTLGKPALSRGVETLRENLTPVFSHVFQGCVVGNKKAECKAVNGLRGPGARKGDIALFGSGPSSCLEKTSREHFTYTARLW